MPPRQWTRLRSNAKTVKRHGLEQMSWRWNQCLKLLRACRRSPAATHARHVANGTLEGFEARALPREADASVSGFSDTALS